MNIKNVCGAGGRYYYAWSSFSLLFSELFKEYCVMEQDNIDNDLSDSGSFIWKALLESSTTTNTLVEQLQNDVELRNVVLQRPKRGYYKCTHCVATFHDLFEYAKHMDENSIVREYKCPFQLCPWRVLGFPGRSDLRRHCGIQHKNELYSLPIKYRQEMNLRDGGETESPGISKQTDYKCPYQYCEKVFYRRDAYTRHINMVHKRLDSRFNKRLMYVMHSCPDFTTEQEKLDYITRRMYRKT